MSSFLYVVPFPGLVVLLWAVGGASMGFATVSSQGYLTLAASAGSLGLSSALYNWGYTIGGAIGAPLAALILGQNNFYALGLALVSLGLFNTLFATIILPQLRPPPSPPGTTPAQHSYITLLRRRRIFLLGLLRFLPTCYYGVMTLLPLLIKQQGGSNASVALYVAASSIFASLTQLVAGRSADRWGVRLPTQIAFAVILLAIAGTIITAQSVWGLYIFGALGVGAAWALSTLLPGQVTMAAEPAIHGRIFGMLHLLWTAAMILGTLLGGILLETDLRLPFLIVGVLNAVALILTVPFFQMKTPQLPRRIMWRFISIREIQAQKWHGFRNATGCQMAMGGIGIPVAVFEDDFILPIESAIMILRKKEI